MKPGRKTQAKEAAIAKGTYRKDRHEHASGKGSVVLTQLPKPPDGLKAAGKKQWQIACKATINLGILAPEDLGMLFHYCKCHDYMSEAEADIEARGLRVKGERGTDVANPSLRIHKQFHDLACKLAAKFGLTPADRAALGLSYTKGKNEGLRYKYLS